MRNVPARIQALLALALGILFIGIGLNVSEGNPADTSPNQLGMQTASVVIDGKKVTLPLVNGDSNGPVNGIVADADPRTPKVRDGKVTPSWSDLDTLLGKDTHYTKCVNDTLGTTWTTDIPRFKQTEQDHQITMILASNASELSRAQIIANARMESPSITDSIKIVRKGAFVNTTKETCTPFVDNRKNFVRAFVGVPVYDKNGKLVGVKDDRGVFHGCHNPWFIPEKITPTPTPSGSESPSDNPSPSGSTTPPETPSSSPPPSSTPPGTPTPKNPEKGPDQQGNTDNGGKNDDPGPGESKSSSEMERPDKPRTNPPSPSATKSTPPVITPKPPSGGGGASATPTVDPGDDENDGTVPTEGCGPPFC